MADINGLRKAVRQYDPTLDVVRNPKGFLEIVAIFADNPFGAKRPHPLYAFVDGLGRPFIPSTLYVTQLLNRCDTWKMDKEDKNKTDWNYQIDKSKAEFKEKTRIKMLQDTKDEMMEHKNELMNIKVVGVNGLK